MASIKHSAGFDIQQPIQRVFPLFSAEGETLWVPGWTYENIMGSKELREDYIFLTESHDHASTRAIWLVKRFEPENHFVQFYKVEPEEKVGIITIQCSAKEQSLTHTQVTYEYIGLSRKGNAFIASFSKQKYREFIDEWHSLLTSHFKSAD